MSPFFVCRWKYSLEGQLTKATRLKGIKNFSPRDFGLIELAVAQWGPFVFIHMGASGEKRQHKIQPSQIPSLHQQLAPLKSMIEPQFGDLSQLQWIGSKEFEVNCNWKLVNDNYLDGEYHIPYIHPGSPLLSLLVVGQLPLLHLYIYTFFFGRPQFTIRHGHLSNEAVRRI